ncbi:MAG TPA: flagellar biosynthesis protein FlhF [Nitrospirae bacterium]|nr:flagellar biosynthesis protein FlhF [Nitrospirota bacterium]
MRIKKIQAKNFRQALALVKKELGADAVILSSEDRKGSRPYVEVTAAIDYDLETDNNANYSPMQASVDISGRSEFAELKKDIKSLTESIEAMQNSGFELTMPEERRKMFNFLRERSIKDEFALKLVAKANDTDDLEALISKEIGSPAPSRSKSPGNEKVAFNAGKRIAMLIGPTGVGKTTTIAKLASKAIKEGRKVGIISIDSYKIGAAEQIRIYARMIGIPLDIVSNVESLEESIKKFYDRDIVLIDTTGQNPQDREYIKGLKDIYNTGLPIETQLLLSASSDCDFLMSTHEHYRSLPIDYIAFTKTDEAVKLGSIYNLCHLYRKPVAYITTGQRVPGNIEFADSGRLTNLILKTGSA